MFFINNIIENELKSATPKRRYLNNRDAILLIKELEKSSRSATLEEKEILAKYNGWGSVHQVFNINPSGWAKDAQAELREILTQEEYSKASESIINAHYTDPVIIREIWGIVQRLGFTGGKILEPAFGTGLFLQAMPEDIRKNSQIIGVELEKLSGAVAKYLHEDAHINIKGFEQVVLPDKYFDLAISNVPFGSYKLHDPRYQHLSLPIHNYFFAKSADLVRPGGLIAFITSTYTLDARGSYNFRKWLGNRVKLIKAIRLPAGAQQGIANTKVTTDLLIFQKLEEGETGNFAEWGATRQIQIDQSDWGLKEDEAGHADLNKIYCSEFNARSCDLRNLKTAEYYEKAGNQQLATNYRSLVNNTKHCMLGIPSLNELYGDGFALKNDGRDLAQALKKFEFQPVYGDLPEQAGAEAEQQLIPPELSEVKDQSFCEYQGNIYKRNGAYLEKSDIKPELVRSFWRLRQVLQELVAAQITASDEVLAQNQALLLKEYNYFKAKHGLINAKKNLIALGADPNYYLVRTLEVGINKLADIFYKRVCRTDTSNEAATTAADGLLHSMRNFGKVDIEYIAALINKSVEEVIEELSNADTIYFDPRKNKWVKTDEYLSGNVYQKLQEAIKSKLDKNVIALKAVQPLPRLPKTSDTQTKLACIEELGIDWESLNEATRDKMLRKTINLRLGASWVPGSIWSEFAAEVLGITLKCDFYGAAGGAWTVVGKSNDNQKYGTYYLNSAEILKKGLNQEDTYVAIHDSIGELNKMQTAIATEEARTKLKLIKAEFADWIWKSRERAVKLCTLYNKTINVFRERQCDSSWVTLPGSNPDIELNWWQKGAVVRILEQDATFLAHDVGLGKTWSMCAGIMEARRLGLAKKPILVVLNDTEQQIADDFKKLYPMANLLLPTKLDAEGRKLFTAALATADFDCAIITHSQFFTLAVPQEQQLAFLNQEKEIVEDFLEEVKNDRGSSKQIKRVLRNIESKIERVNKSVRKDNHIEFIGLCDMLVLDEIHKFKNLFVFSKMNDVRGIPTNYSQRATDTYLKILNVLGELFNNDNSAFKGKVVGATGTIISNTLAELFNWMRMFMGQTLKQLHIEAFDSFASQFAEAVSSAEITASGKYKVITRMKNFSDLPVLRNLLSQFIDIKTAEHAGDKLVRPFANYINIIAQPSEAQLQFLSEALKRSEAIYNGTVDPRDDNMLKITTDLTKAALSMRLLGELKEAPESKINECILNVYRIWKATTPIKSTQAIFCDYSIPSKYKYSVYNYVKVMLIALGVPSHEIEFIHDHNGKGKRKKLFESINSGKVRIILGSTQKLGTGCNIHECGLIAAHHLDAPWRPADIEQREGRLIRQGNGKRLSKQLSKCWIFRYITERLDALRWQTLEWKQSMIRAFMNGFDIEEMSDVDESAYSFAQVKNMATGNPLLIEETNLINELNSLLLLQRAHEQNQFNLEYTIKQCKTNIEFLNNEIAHAKEMQPLIQPALTGEKARKELAARIRGGIADVKLHKLQEFKAIADYRGFTLYVKSNKISDELDVYIKAPTGKNFIFPYFDFGTIKLNQVTPLQSLDTVINGLASDDYILNLYDSLRIKENTLEESLPLVGKPFADADRIDAIRRRLSEISTLIAEQETVISKESSKDSKSKKDTEENEEEKIYLGDDLTTVENVSANSVIVEYLKRRLEDDDAEAQPDWLKDIKAIISEYHIEQPAVESLTLSKIEAPTKIVELPGLNRKEHIEQLLQEIAAVTEPIWNPLTITHPTSNKVKSSKMKSNPNHQSVTKNHKARVENLEGANQAIQLSLFSAIEG